MQEGLRGSPGRFRSAILLDTAMATYSQPVQVQGHEDYEQT